MKINIRHYAGHINWWGLSVFYLLLAFAAWDNSRWWIAVIIMVALPPIAAMRGHLLCKIEEDIRKRAT